MAPPKLSDELAKQAVEALKAQGGNQTLAAESLGIGRGTFQGRIRVAAQRGMMLDHPPAMPGFRIAQVTTAPDGSQHIQQKPEHGEPFALPAGHRIKGVSTLVNAEGGKIVEWIKTTEDADAAAAAMAATIAALTEQLPRAESVPPPPARWRQRQPPQPVHRHRSAFRDAVVERGNGIRLRPENCRATIARLVRRRHPPKS